MSRAVRTYLVWALVGVALFAFLTLVDRDSALRERENLWVIPVGGAVAGALGAARMRLSDRARRRGIEWSGRDPDDVEAESRRAERRFRSKHPVLFALAVVAFVAVAAGAIWLRATT